ESWVGLDPQAAMPAAGQLAAAVVSFLRHVVRRGETLSSIGLQYGIQVSKLVKANHLQDASRIRAGQVLLIPPAP
ncbi:MAG: LysM domain-containing protein, partial [Acidobacteriota bacterium]